MMRTRTLAAALVGLGVLSAAAGTQAAPAAVTRGGLIFVPGIVHTPAGGGGAFAAQADGVLAALASQLKEQGTDLGRVVATTVYLKHAGDFPALNAAWARAWPNEPPTRTTVIAALPSPDALLQVSAVAVPPGAERRVILPDGWARPTSPYSYAIRTGDTVFLSGLIPRNPRDGSLVTGDIAAQVGAIFENARALLAAAGLGLPDVVNTRAYLTDAANFQAMNAAYRPHFPAAPPTRATVLCGLPHPNDLVEFTFTAAAGTGRQVITPPSADGRPAAPNPVLSSAILAGSRLYLSGMLGATPANAGDLPAQTTETLTRLERSMTAAGYSWSNVGDVVVYLTDIAKADAVRTIVAARASGATVPITIVGTGLVVPNGLIEIMLSAWK